MYSTNGFLAVTPPTNTKVEAKAANGFVRVAQKVGLTELRLVFAPGLDSKLFGQVKVGDSLWFHPDVSFHDNRVFEQDGREFILVQEGLLRLYAGSPEVK